LGCDTAGQVAHVNWLEGQIMAQITIHLVRHSKVDGHWGDVPLADDAGQYIDAAAAYVASLAVSGEHIAFLATQTRRTRDTAQGLRDRMQGRSLGLSLGEVRQEYAIRNPDLYLAGHRVEMVSTGAAMAAQLPEGLLTGTQVEATAFYADFFRARDRIEHWLRHNNPPGEDATAVARRTLQFCKSLGDVDTAHDLRVIAVSHSPVMRAVLVHFMGLADPGEPDWVEPIDIILTKDGGSIRFRDTTKPLTI
jgi:broad specificity phosphatase PhoE